MPSLLSQFIDELRRRRVFRVAVVYAGVAFIVFQIVDATFEPLHLPDWASTLVVVFLALGFPIAVGLAWAFDITEQGVVRTAAKEEAAPTERPSRPLLGNTTLAIVAAVAVAVAVWSWWGRPASVGAITSIAVLPLENLMGDPDQDYFVDGMHEALITELSRISALKVISRTSAMRYKNTDQLVPAIAKELGVDAVVEGSVLKAGNRVRITAQLIHGTTDKHLWVNDYERDLTDILTLQKNVAQAIAKEIKVALTTEEEAHLASARSINPEAYEAYLKGRYFWNKRTEDDLKSAIDYFEQAIQIDQNYAMAYAGLADSYLLLPYYSPFPPKEAFPEAKIAATKALEKDNTLADAHTSLAMIRAGYDWDWVEAEKEFKQAIELNPGYATAHHWYAWLLMWIARFDEAIEEIKRAQQLDPLSLVINNDVGTMFYHARQYNQAIEALEKVIKMNPNFPNAHSLMGRVYLQKSMYTEAMGELQKEMQQSKRRNLSTESLIGLVYLKLGQKSKAKEILDELTQLSKRQYVPPYQVALIHTGLGDKGQALEWLQKAYVEKDNWLAWLKVDPLLDPLRGDPRFQDLLRRMNFPE